MISAAETTRHQDFVLCANAQCGAILAERLPSGVYLIRHGGRWWCVRELVETECPNCRARWADSTA